MRADIDNDGFIPTSDLAKTQSVERKMVDGVLEDAGADSFLPSCLILFCCHYLMQADCSGDWPYNIAPATAWKHWLQAL